MNNTKIEWVKNSDGSQGKTWNFLRGCRRVSEGCRNCYAEQIAGRFSGVDKNGKELPYFGLATRTASGSRWTGKVSFDEKTLLEPLKRKTPTTYFVNSMSDLFYEEVPDEWIDKAFAVMALTPQHTYQILTKRPERMRNYFADTLYRKGKIGTEINNISFFHGTKEQIGLGIKLINTNYDCLRTLPIKNIWLGVSVENQKEKARIDILRDIPSAIRFISFEPLLEDLSNLNLENIHWAIIGGESGNGARPFHLEHALDIIHQCRNAGTKVFFKQAGAFCVTENVNLYDFPDSVKFEDWGKAAASARVVFKDKKGGNLDELPFDFHVREMPII